MAVFRLLNPHEHAVHEGKDIAQKWVLVAEDAMVLKEKRGVPSHWVGFLEMTMSQMYVLCPLGIIIDADLI